MSVTLENLTEWLGNLLREKHDSKAIKLLNIGTNSPREYHWRFRMSGGEIITITIEQEGEP